MSLDAPAKPSPPIQSVDELVSWFREGEKPLARHRVGLETEKIGVVARTGAPAPLQTIGRLLERFAEHTGGKLLLENGTAIGVQLTDSSLALEPGGQLELSGAPATRLSQIADELRRHLEDTRRFSEPLGLAWLAIGYRPFGPREDVPWLPRGRYALMRARMPGKYAHDMMQMSASVQANFDFQDEEDLAAKVSTATAVSPLVSALYVNAPLRDGALTEFLSFRYFLWGDVDPSRAGLLRAMYEPGFTYRRYLDWALAAPLLFVRRGGRYVDPEGRTFRDLLRDGFAGEPATMPDFVDLLSTLFPEIRVKRVLEVRGQDAVDLPMTLALPALWAALLYDPQARHDARALVTVPFEELVRFQERVARDGLEAKLDGRRAVDLAGDLLKIADDGLRRLAEQGRAEGADRAFLDPLREVVRSGVTPAERVRSMFKSTGDRAAVIAALRY